MIESQAPSQSQLQAPWRVLPVDALLGALLVVAASVWLAVSHAHPLAYAAALPALAVVPLLGRIDHEIQRLPNVCTLPLLGYGVLVGVASALVLPGFGAWLAFGAAALLLVLAFAGAMGMGDAKFGAALLLCASALGSWAPLVSLAVAFVAGGIVGMTLLARGRRDVPFGPWLGLGFVAAVALTH